MRLARLVVVPITVALAVAIAACGSSASTQPKMPDPGREPAPPPTTAAPDAAPAASAPAAPLPAGVPDTPVGHQLAWVLDVITARHGALDEAAAQAHFTPAFLAQVPPAQAVTVFAQLGAQLAGLALDGVTAPAPGGLIAKISVGGSKLVIKIGVDATTGMIDGLLFEADADAVPKPTSWAELDAALAALAPKAAVLVARVDKGACEPIHALAAKTELAIASTFKLYVLLAVVDQILAGKLAWDTEVEVKDAWKSLPSGVTQDAAAGSKLTVRELANRMISISDNTATDHLLYTVTRRRAEAAVKAAKHAKPALDVPFLSTRELFLFRLGLPDAEVDAYLAKSAEQRRAYLDETLAGKAATLDGLESWTGARRIDTLEWFASATDVCNVLATIGKRAEKPAAGAALEALSINPGLGTIDKATWPFIGFKGGSEPGVLSGAWLLRRDDGAWYVVTAVLNSPNALDEMQAFGVIAGAFDLAAKDHR